MTTKKLMLNSAYRHKDGTYPLVVQLLHQRRKRVIYTRLDLHREEFNEQLGIVVPNKQYGRSMTEIRKLNRTITAFVDRIEQVIRHFDESGKPYDVSELVKHYLIAMEGGSLRDYWEQYIIRLQQQGRMGMAAAQRSTLHSLLRFNGSKDIRFTGLATSFIRAYKDYLATHELSPNTICFYIRNMKVLVNQAIKDKMMMPPRENLFEGIESRPRKTVKRALDRDTLRTLAFADFGDNPDADLARDVFMFSYYTRGMAFVDIAFLKKENICGDIIRYARRKTGQCLQITINEPIRKLLDKYRSVSQYLFPMLTDSDPVVAYKQYRVALRGVNTSLKTVCLLLHIPVRLTTYVARHSWATQARERGVLLSVISEGLGHTSEHITQIYLKEFDQSVLDSANDLISTL